MRDKYKRLLLVSAIALGAAMLSGIDLPEPEPAGKSIAGIAAELCRDFPPEQQTDFIHLAEEDPGFFLQIIAE